MGAQTATQTGDSMNDNNRTKINYSINERREYMWSQPTYSVFVDGKIVEKNWTSFHEALDWVHSQPAWHL